MRRSCNVCGTPYEAKSRTSMYCGKTCGMRASRKRRAEEASGTVVAIGPTSAEVGEVAGAVESATLAVLTDTARVDTPLGRAALVMARKVDGGRDTGAGLAALVKQLEATLRSATSGVAQDSSPLDNARDELAARRASA